MSSNNCGMRPFDVLRLGTAVPRCLIGIQPSVGLYTVLSTLVGLSLVFHVYFDQLMIVWLSIPNNIVLYRFSGYIMIC